MQEHISESTFDALFRSPDVVGEEELKNIALHLEDCASCREHYDALKAFYLNLDANLNTPLSERDRAFAEKLLVRKRLALPLRAIEKRKEDVLDAYAEVIEPYYRPLPQRIVRFIQIHPIKFAGGFSLVAAALAVFILMPRSPKDDNPSFFRSKSGIIHIYNRFGEELWTKTAGGVPDDSTREILNGDEDRTPPVRIFDIDGDGLSEVMITGFQSKGFSEESLYCFNSNGRLRWRHGMGEGIKFGTIDFAKNPTWGITKFFPIRRSPNDRIQLFVIGMIHPSWPSKLAELDPMTGRELQHYWHTGGLTTVIAADIDRDGKQELVVGGINNSYNSACVIVFDPTFVSGVGPCAPDFMPDGLSPGSEQYYLLLPPTSLCGKITLARPYNAVRILSVAESGIISLGTGEIQVEDNYKAGIMYSFSREMILSYVIANDPFVVEFDRAKRNGLISDSLDATYYQRLKDAVRYWDGGRFVKEPTMNKLHLKRPLAP